MLGLNLLAAYFAATGGVAASSQAARGVVRGAARLIKGDSRGALIEAVAGVSAPVVTAVNQVALLGREVYRAVGTLAAPPIAVANAVKRKVKRPAATDGAGEPPLSQAA